MDIKNGMTVSMRHAKEHEFFKQAPWSSLPKDRVGIAALRTYLAQLLYDHIQNEFPQLVQEIRMMTEECRGELDALGPARETLVQQRQFLISVATQYQSETTAALKGSDNPRYGPKDTRKIMALIHAANDRLVNKIHLRGHKYKWRSTDEDASTKGEQHKDDLGDYDMGDDGEDDATTGTNDEHKDIYSWIRYTYRNSRGLELPGTINPAVLENLFREQAEPWQALTGEYLDTVHRLIQRYNKRMFSNLFRDDGVRRSITERNKKAENATERLAFAQFETLLKDEMEGMLQTTNHYFAEVLAQSRQDRHTHRLSKFFSAKGDTTDGGVTFRSSQIILQDIINATHLSNEDSAVLGIHDILKAYYKVAEHRFVDNITKQVVERYYLGLDGPLRYITPAYVGGLTDEELSNVGGESNATSLERVRLSTQLEQLKKALSLGEAEL